MNKSTRPQVFEAINSERDYQNKKWGGPVRDEKNSIADFILFMEHHLERARTAATTLDGRPENLEAMLSHVRKVTALGVACMEVHGAPHRGNNKEQGVRVGKAMMEEDSL